MRATTIRTYDEREVVIRNADMFAHSVIVNTAVGTRRWQYDIDTKRTVSLQELKDAIVNGGR